MAQANATLTSLALQSVKENNKLRAEDFAVHDWYRFVLSYPPHLVRDYLTRLGAGSGTNVLDPFCGSGTTAVASHNLSRNWIMIDSSFSACRVAVRRLRTLGVETKIATA